MVWEIYTWGGGEALYYIFNAVAAFFSCGSAHQVGAMLVTLAGYLSAAIISYQLAFKQDIKMTAQWVFTYMLLSMILITPKVSVHIEDPLSRFHRRVDNVPFLLGTFASLSSRIGKVLSAKMDMLYSLPDSAKIENGMAMASQLVSKSTAFSITDPDAASNIREFMQQCVLFDIARGKYSMQSLLTTNNLWEFLKEHASKSRSFAYRERGGISSGRSAQILSCTMGAQRIDRDWNGILNHAVNVYAPRFFSEKKLDYRAEFLKHLPVSYSYLTKISQDANSILRQNLMANAIQESLLTFNQSTDASAAITGYATTRALAQQKTAYELQGSMATLILPVMRIVMEALFYGIFPLIVILCAMPIGFGVLKKYIIALFYLQSWGPIYSILNLMINLFAKTKSIAAVKLANGSSALSLATLNGLNEANSWVAAMAGYATMSVPFLAYGLFNYGAGALSQLSAHFGSISQSAASHGAEEATTGNYSLGNTNFDNHSQHNTSGFKYDTNMLVASGKNSFQMHDGGNISTSPSGEVIFDRSNAISRLGADINMSGSIANSFSESAENAHRMGESNTIQASDSLAAAFTKADEFRNQISHDVGSDTSFVNRQEAQQSKQLTEAIDKMKEYSKSKNLSVEEGFRLFAGISTPGFSPVKAGAEGSLSTNLREDQREALQYAQKHGILDQIQNVVSNSKSAQFRTGDSVADQTMNSINSNLQKAHSFSEAAQLNYSQEDQYRQSEQYYRNQGAAFNQNISQEIAKELYSEYGNQAYEILSDEQKLKGYLNATISSRAGNFKSGTSPSTIQDSYATKSQSFSQADDSVLNRKSNYFKSEVQNQSQSSLKDAGVSVDAKNTVNTGMQNMNEKINQGSDPLRKESVEKISNREGLTSKLVHVKED
ncbi:MAG: conjugal transfer protein TraG N-terminal domain-containing protein [Gammaproteobacteria bacterium]